MLIQRFVTTIYFNSRLRKETNDDHATGAPDIYAFQLTSPQGNERPRKPLSLAPVYFNSRLLTETNKMMEQLNGKRAHFNSRLLTETNKDWHD